MKYMYKPTKTVVESAKELDSALFELVKEKKTARTATAKSAPKTASKK